MGAIQRFRTALARRLGGEELRSRTALVNEYSNLGNLGLSLPSASGRYINDKTALTVSAVYACVTLLADSVAKVPLRLYRKTETGREEAIDHPAYEIVALSPNKTQTSFEFRRLMQGLVGLRGNAYARVRRNEFYEVTALEAISPEAVQPHTLTLADGTQEITYRINGSNEILTRADILHVSGFGTENGVGLSPIRLMADSIGNSIGQREQTGRVMQNGAKFPGFISTPNALSEPQLNLLKRKWREEQAGIANAGNTPILFGGVTWNTVGMTSEDAQLLQTRVFEVEEVARAYRVPLHMIQSTEKTTSFGSGIEQMDRAFLNLSLDPHLVAWEEAMNLTILSRAHRRKGYYFKFNRNAIIQIAAKDLAEIARLYRDMAVWSVDDVRDKLEMNHLPDDIGADYQLPFNGSGGAAKAAADQSNNPNPPADATA